MQGALRQARSSARSFLVLPSVLALLALALFPVAARAECSTASCLTYETEVPNVESTPSTGGHHPGNSATHNKSSNNAKAEGSAAETAGGGAEESAQENESSEGHKSKEGSSAKKEESHPATAAGGNGGGNGPQGSISEGKNLGGTQPGTNTSHSSGGSSPVVPILIAVVVLAAISIGVVLYRQRKSGQDGPDGRVSSSNAS